MSDYPTWLKRVSWFFTIIFIVLVVVPLAAERLSLSRKWKSQFATFQLTDEDGKTHAGLFAWARVILFDTQFLEYGYEPGREVNLSEWRKKIAGIDEEKLQRKDGFLWSDKGFLWSHENLIKVGNEFIQEGKRLDTVAAFTDQSEIVLPGAPLDVQTPNLSYFGKYPDYQVEYVNNDFKFDFVFHARNEGWYVHNEGKPFPTGDFGWGYVNELACDVDGMILHKKQNRRFHVKGTGVLEDAIGLPWSWIEWGSHDWMDIHFPNGWSGTLTKAKDDWQWGYHRKPEIGWLFDPEKEKFHTFYRIDVLTMDMKWDDVNGYEYPVSSRWRAIGEEGTLEMDVKLVTYKPRETRIPYTPFSIKMSYGLNAFGARFIRRDGSTVELKNGYGTMEHFMNLIPDYRYIGPALLILVILTWGATAIAYRVNEKRPVRAVIIWTAVAVIAVLFLYWTWSA